MDQWLVIHRHNIELHELRKFTVTQVFFLLYTENSVLVQKMAILLFGTGNTDERQTGYLRKGLGAAPDNHAFYLPFPSNSDTLIS